MMASLAIVLSWAVGAGAAAPPEAAAPEPAGHPLVVEFSKPGYNVHAAVQAGGLGGNRHVVE